ncbi:MAG: hypothetical protein ACKVW3_03660 [Phycisphaerales bacterium]
MTRRKVVTAAALLLASSTAMAVENVVAPLPADTQALLNLYPGSRAELDQGKVRILYGVPMTAGITPADAAQRFIVEHGSAFGVGQLTATQTFSTPTSDGKFTISGYTQHINGVPVEYGNLRIMVKHDPFPQVVYAAGTLAPMPEGGLNAAALEGPMALRLAQAHMLARGAKVWTAPQLVVFQGEGTWAAPILAWKMTASSPNPADAYAMTFFIDARTGVTLHVRNDVVNTDVAGTVKGFGTQGTSPDTNTNLPVLMDIPEIRVTIQGGNNTVSDRLGVFSILNPGTTPVTVLTGVHSNVSGGGPWVNVVPVSLGPTVSGTLANVTPPGPANFILNPTPSQGLTAQINTFIGVTKTHNMFKDRAPAFTALDIALTSNTGVAGTCNANFNPSNLTINFFNAGGGCVNTAYSGVISHEYGHFIVNRLNLAQGAFGEGFGDCCAELLWDDFILGRDFSGPGTNVRNPIASNIQYPCGSAIHTCGMVLGGGWWRTRENFGTFYGSADGLNRTRDLFVKWALMTVGGSGSNAAVPANIVEILVADDNDGNTSNGTPNYSRICPAWAAHSLPCPAVSLIGFQYPSGRPTTILPNQTFSFPVNAVAISVAPVAGTGTLSYRIGTAGAFTTISMPQGAANQYTAVLPAAPCGSIVQYYVGATATGGTIVTDPQNAPTSVFSTIAVTGTTTVADLNMNTDPGWTVTNDPSLLSGQWERGVPVTPAPTNCPPADFNGGGGQAWVTHNLAGNFDVDNGPTTLTTGVYNLSAYPSVEVSYARWIQSINGVLDTLRFEYSTNNGGTWTLLENAATTAGWNVVTFTVAAPTAQTRFRWIANDNPNDSVTEGGVDRFRIVGFTCGTATCYANCDGSTSAPILNVNDFVCFQNLFAAGSSLANCDGSTIPPVLNVNDFVCFQNAFSAGCP